MGMWGFGAEGGGGCAKKRPGTSPICDLWAWVCEDGQGFGISETNFNVICSWYDQQKRVKRILSCRD